MNFMKSFIQGSLISCMAVVLLTSAGYAASGADAARFIPIQHNGRVKSFDAFSRQMVETISGKGHWNHRSSADVVLESLYLKKRAYETPWIRVPSKTLCEKLGLPGDRLHFSYNEIMPVATALENLARGAQVKRDNDERPSKVEQEAETLYQRMILVRQLVNGESLKVIPFLAGQSWLSPDEESGGARAKQFNDLLELYGTKKYGEFTTAAKAWTESVHKTTDSHFRRKIALEICYLSFQPFQWAWIFYLLAFMVLSTLNRAKIGCWSGIAFMAIALFCHSYGLLLRVLILERPPVSNMYESMIYMNWALMVFAAVFSAAKKNLTFISVGSMISALVLIYGTLLPLDSNLEVLVPVLRSNYWLTIHVLTIVSSYGAFGLAMGLGHRHLILDLRGKFSKNTEEISAKLIYNVIQLGVLLLGIGTVLGGVWANESWGRFWGWDPKETWALITFLGYLGVVHLRHSKLIKPFGMAVSSIVGFFLVLMTWYGVNFVLGRGLHSYGFGSGGLMWVMYYVILELVFLAFALLKKYRSKPVR